MAPTDSKSSTKRKTPAFKPPRPGGAKAGESTVGRKRQSNPINHSSPARSKRTVQVDSDDHEDEGGDSDDDEMDEPSRASPSSAVSDVEVHTGSQDAPPSVPPALLTKLLYHHFQDGQTKIGVEARGVVGKYVETFIREAIARAAFERQSGDRGTRGLIGDDFLEVEDLEKLATQLLLDF